MLLLHHQLRYRHQLRSRQLLRYRQQLRCCYVLAGGPGKSSYRQHPYKRETTNVRRHRRAGRSLEGNGSGTASRPAVSAQNSRDGSTNVVPSFALVSIPSCYSLHLSRVS